MTERVVDVLESVQIQEQNGERIAPAALARSRFLDFLRDGGAIGQASERIVMRHECDTLFRLLPFGYVVDDDDEIFRLALAVANDDAARRVNACFIRLRFDIVFKIFSVGGAAQNLVVDAVNEFGGLFVVKIKYRLADQSLAFEAEHRLKRAIDKNELARAD